MSNAATKLQRSEGTVQLSFKQRGFRTVLDTLYQQGCYQARFPKADASLPAEAVLINTSGGLTDGDSLNLRANWHAATTAVISSQAAERIYRSRNDPAIINTSLTIGEDATACWLPQETIVFDGGRLQRSTEVEIAKSASLFAAEIVVMGRTAMGEVVRNAYLFDRWRIRQDDKLIFADALLFDDATQQSLEKHLASSAIAGGASCFATLVYVDENSGDSLGKIRDILAATDVTGGASQLGSLVAARMLANNSQQIRSVIAEVFTAVRGDAFQLPRVWNC